MMVRNDLTGCPWHDVKEMLRHVGLRPTRQRMALGWILFAKGDRHLTAEMLYEEATKAKVPVSLATVYNTLHQFTDVGLLRQVAVDGSKTYFDTNVSDHHHFFVEDENELVDIPSAHVIVGDTPSAPEGYEIARIDVVVRLRRMRAHECRTLKTRSARYHPPLFLLVEFFARVGAPDVGTARPSRRICRRQASTTFRCTLQCGQHARLPGAR